ncbi:hypothetical protein BGW42_006897, partial [Actinomortierella wolfii]
MKLFVTLSAFVTILAALPSVQAGGFCYLPDKEGVCVSGIQVPCKKEKDFQYPLHGGVGWDCNFFSNNCGWCEVHKGDGPPKYPIVEEWCKKNGGEMSYNVKYTDIYVYELS